MPFGPYKNHKDCVRKNQDKKNPDAYCAEIKRRSEGQIKDYTEAPPMSEAEAPKIVKNIAKSTRDIPISERYADIKADVLIDKEIEGGRPQNVYWVNATKVGAKSYTSMGQAVIFTHDSLEANHKTWTSGIVTVNHVKHVAGGILKTKFEDPFVKMAVRVDNPRLRSFINSGNVEGVSIEASDVELDGDQITSFKGTGISFVIFPERPACDADDGCGLAKDLESAEPKDDAAEAVTTGKIITDEAALAKKKEIFEAIGVWKKAEDAIDVQTKTKDADASDILFKEKVEATESESADEDHYTMHGGDCTCHEKLQQKEAEKVSELKTKEPTVPQTDKDADAAPTPPIVDAGEAEKQKSVADAAQTTADTVTPAAASEPEPVADVTDKQTDPETPAEPKVTKAKEEPKGEAKHKEPCACKELEAAVIQGKELNVKQGEVIASLRKELDGLKSEATKLRAFRHNQVREPMEIKAKELGLPEKVVSTLDDEGLKMAIETVEKVAAKGSGAVTGTVKAATSEPREPTFEEIDDAFWRYTHGGKPKPKDR